LQYLCYELGASNGKIIWLQVDVTELNGHNTVAAAGFWYNFGYNTVMSPLPINYKDVIAQTWRLNKDKSSPDKIEAIR
jgi:hypothetical protein